MAAGDIYQVVGGLQGRNAVAFLGGDVDDGIQIDAFAAAPVVVADKYEFTVDNSTGYAIIVKAA